MTARQMSASLKTAMAETTILTVNSLEQYIQLNVLRRETRVPSPMIGQYTLNSSVNANRDTGFVSPVPHPG